MITRRTIVKGIAAAPLALPFVLHGNTLLAQSGPIRVGSKDFPESITIGEMLALLLENAGFQVKVNRFGFSNKVWDYSPVGQAPPGSIITLEVGPF